MTNSLLVSELVRMSLADQDMRNKSIDDDTQWDNTLDKSNTSRLKKIIQEFGWPTISLVGEQASRAAWLLVQHADHDLNFQESCLALMKDLAENEVSQQNIAYLEDRVRIAQGRPQLYGTQFDNPGVNFGPKSVEDSPNLNKRRIAAGLSSFEDYQKLMYEVYSVA